MIGVLIGLVVEVPTVPAIEVLRLPIAAISDWRLEVPPSGPAEAPPSGTLLGNFWDTFGTMLGQFWDTLGMFIGLVFWTSEI